MASSERTQTDNLIYLYTIDDDRHRNMVKVGKASVTYSGAWRDLTPDCKRLNKAARDRINEQTRTAATNYNLRYTELAVFTVKLPDGTEKERQFDDKTVHDILLNSGYKRATFDDLADATPLEWFVIDLATAKRAIAAAKQQRSALPAIHMAKTQKEPAPQITFRQEQQKAVADTLALVRDPASRRMLWFAKMRFGKTLSALETIRQAGFRRTLILTHRPQVRDGWFEDFQKIPFSNTLYGSKGADLPANVDKIGLPPVGYPFATLSQWANEQDDFRYVYFASIQDLRGSKTTGGKFDKNDEIFAEPWDLLIIDEAHEGVRAPAGRRVIDKLRHDHPTMFSLYLSGTPYNLFDQFAENEIFRWDYDMEQQAKLDWPRLHPGEPNPYEGLAQVIFKYYDVGSAMEGLPSNPDGFFTFTEFFKTNDDGSAFVYRDHVKRFVELLRRDDTGSLYPFATEQGRRELDHTFWLLPGVNAVKLLQRMLEEDDYFGKKGLDYKIVNVAGKGDRLPPSLTEADDNTEADSPQAADNAQAAQDDEKKEKDFLAKVQKAVAENPRTITLSCGRLTTGVSVPEWTGVFMLAGGEQIPAMGYMQAAFRAQTPYKKSAGRVKHRCYVYDFAPNRTIVVYQEAFDKTLPKNVSAFDRQEAFMRHMELMPLISTEGSTTRALDALELNDRVTRACADLIVKRGFTGPRMYRSFDSVGPDVIAAIEEIGKKIKEAEQAKTSGSRRRGSGIIDVNKTPTSKDGAERDHCGDAPSADSGPRPVTSVSSRPPRDEKKEKRRQWLATLDHISKRLPLMVFGALSEVNTLSLAELIKKIDPEDWKEFMPKDVDREMFEKILDIYDQDSFAASARIVAKTLRTADLLPVEQRIDQITRLISDFQNPDKETVLTPWRVVNMHMADTLGGWCFFSEEFPQQPDLPVGRPRRVEHPGVTQRVFRPDARVLEINSKTGLYPLYVAYSLYRARLDALGLDPGALSVEQQWQHWVGTVRECLFVVCKTPMARLITLRTLLGFRPGKANARYFDDLINQIKEHPANFVNRVVRGRSYWQSNQDDNMKFNAIVGNPPYQTPSKDNRVTSRDNPVYQYFVETAKKIPNEFISLIMPSRWMASGLGLGDFRDTMLKDDKIAVLVDFPDPTNVFPNVEIKGGVCYFLRSAMHNGKCLMTTSRNGQRSKPVSRSLSDFDILIRNSGGVPILEKVLLKGEKSITEILAVDKEFGWTSNYEGFHDVEQPGDVPFFYNRKSKRYQGFKARSEVDKSTHLIDTWKVFVAQAGSDGGKRIPDAVLSVPFVGPNPSVCTQSYLFFYTDSQEERDNILKYVKTRFLRFLVSLRKITQHATRSTYTWVPLQDFTTGGEIDWTQPVEQIDRQLFDRYGLTDDERAFINQTIKPM